jgi:hypothetical protein
LSRIWRPIMPVMGVPASGNYLRFSRIGKAFVMSHSRLGRPILNCRSGNAG